MLAVSSGIVDLTVKGAGCDLICCALFSLASYCSDLGNCILCVNAAYLFLVKVSLTFFLFSLSLAFCWLFHRGVFSLQVMFGQLHFRLALFIGSYCHGTPEQAFLFDIA